MVIRLILVNLKKLLKIKSTYYRDAAQVYGSKYKNNFRFIWRFSAFSFHQTKNLQLYRGDTLNNERLII